MGFGRYGQLSDDTGALDYLPGYDDRKTIADLWQRHAPLPEAEHEAINEALVAVAQWGYVQALIALGVTYPSWLDTEA